MNTGKVDNTGAERNQSISMQISPVTLQLTTDANTTTGRCSIIPNQLNPFY